MSKMVDIWDIPTRLFHWTLVVLFVFLIISGDSDDMMEWHFYAGYLLSGLILFRVIWGVLGTRYARFSSFKLSPVEVLAYAKGLLSHKHTVHYGHTPAGSVMVVVLLGLLGIQLVTGMMSTDDIIWSGPLYNSVSEATAELAGEIHEIIQGLLQLLIGLHILAIIIYKVKFNEPLVPAMIHGKKPKQESESDQPVEREGTGLVKLLLAVVPAGGLIYWLFSIPV